MKIIGAVELQRDDDLSGAIDKAPLAVFLDGKECLRGLRLRLVRSTTCRWQAT